MARYLLTSALLLFTITASSQVTEREQYNHFKQQARMEYADFRKKCNAEYAAFLEQVWESYEAGPIISKPKDETVPPVVMPKEDVDNPIDSNPVPIDSVVSPIDWNPQPQPKPIAPIYENRQPTTALLQFTFFGTECEVRMPKDRARSVEQLNTNLSNKTVSKAWEELSKGDYDNLIRDCLELRIRLQLCDWAYLLMIRELSEKYYGERTNAATMLMSWIYCQTGYQMRMAMTANKIYLLFGSKHTIYNWSYYKVDGINFYPFLHDGENIREAIQICDSAFPKEQAMSLYIPNAQLFAESLSTERTITSERYPEASAKVQINKNLIDFYNTYPTSVIGENHCTRWAMYANTPIAENVKTRLYPQLKNFIAGKSDIEAANILLNWVQTGFEYEYDDKVWGGDRALFSEESLFYPYCDCEDRSILFTRLIRDLLELKCILVSYPHHLACAVQFKSQVDGDYVNLSGNRFVITDPTYIGAKVGRTMPDMDNKTANVIQLD